MNMLGLVFSAPLFQQNNHKESSVGDVSMPAFSASRGVSKSSEKSTEETLHDVKLQEHQISEETFQKSSDDAVAFSRTASGIDKSVGSTSNIPNQPRKRNKKKNKKRKFDKKHGNSNAALPSIKLLDSTVKVVQAFKEANDSLFHDKLASKNNSRCSESIFKTAGSEDVAEFTDDEFLQEKTKENSEAIVALTTSLGRLQRIDDTNSKPGTEQRKGPVVFLDSGVLTSSTGGKIGCRPGRLEDASNCKTKSLIKPACNHDSDLTEVSWKLNEISSVAKTSNVIQDEATADSNNPAANQNADTCASSLSIDCDSPHMGSSRINLSGKETCTDDRFDVANSKSQSSNVNDDRAIAPHENVDCRRPARTQTAVDALKSHCFTNSHKQLGKENRHYIWKKTKDIGVKQAYSRIYNHDLLWRNSCSRDRSEFFTPECIGRGCLHRRVSGFDFVGPEMSSHAQVRLESSQCLSHQSFHGQPRKYTPRSWGGYPAVSFTWKMSEDGSTPPFKRENANHIRRYWVSRENLSKLQRRKYFAEGETLNVPRADLYRRSTCGRTDIHDNSRRVSDSFDAWKVQLARSFLAHFSCMRSNGPWTRSSGHQKLLHEMQPRAGTKVPLSVDLSAGASQASMVVEEKASAFPENRLSYDSTKEQWTTSSVSSQMQISLPTNYSSTCQTSTNIGVRLASGNQETDIPMRIGSRMAVQVLDAAFRMQLDSDGFQLATKRPIAEFERLLRDISPVIDQPFVWHNGEDSIGDQPITIPLNRSQYPKVLLLDVWSWYKTFSCYGLKFKTQVSQTAPCHAHFYPMLSAVQLFGRSQHPSSGSSPGSLRHEVAEKEECKKHTSVVFSYPESPVGASASYYEHNIHSCSPIQPSDEPKLIFQYFEDEPPRLRKPLYAKIEELLEVGGSNTKAYGDPTKLGCSNLQDLHPASWFSVAWYPIYQIPGGDLKAKFLTYHSFGHLVLRQANPDLAEGNALRAIFPALGMVSNKVAGWLDPTRLPESLFGGMPLDSCQIIADRLQTLNETAKLFAKGEVLKDKVFVCNKQLDYEFLIDSSHLCAQ